ncbi:cytochrome b-c1 complex subunit 9 [Elgaria multicarinata webbii]|uniref:cytochrome b-c1 complex subunit 9 n=1 Tax=Elgaria multicarinata webbii TaxID=159646 RepID=UPI002FCD659B
MRGSERQPKMALVRKIYSAMFRRTSTFALTIVVGVLLYERAFDQVTDGLFEYLNKGKLWKHIKHKYESAEE